MDRPLSVRRVKPPNTIVPTTIPLVPNSHQPTARGVDWTLAQAGKNHRNSPCGFSISAASAVGWPANVAFHRRASRVRGDSGGDGGVRYPRLLAGEVPGRAAVPRGDRVPNRAKMFLGTVE